MKRVTAAVIIEGGRLFLARRAPGDPLEGLWELPGGKIEIGETPQECLERELLEELRMASKAHAIVATTVHHYGHGSFEMLAIHVDRHSGYQPMVHDAVAWVSRDELPACPLAPADIDLVAQLHDAGVW